MTDHQLTYLFIDESKIEHLDNVVQGVGPATKIGDQPLLRCDQPWAKDWEFGGYTNVMYDADDGLFKMWYNVRRPLSEQRGEEADGLAYAFSEDGINWQTPVLNLVEDNGSTDNNLVFPFFRWGAGNSVFKDPIETDPAKRYKMLFMLQSESMRFAGICQPVCVAYSADGIYWNVPPGWLNPVIPEGTDTQIVAYWEPKIRRYVVYLRGRPNVRIICMAESEDFESWTPRQTIVEPDEQDPPQDREFYGMSSMLYRDMRIGFLSIFHTLNEGWIAANQIEPWMPEWMNQMDVQLTYSHDGRTWHRAGNREPVLVCGDSGAYDSGSVLPPNAPFIIDDEIWIYHHGSNRLHGEQTRDGVPPQEGVNLAKIKKDRLVCLKTDAEGVVTTTSLAANPEKLWLNADASNGSIRVELLDPFDRVIAGYGAEDCVPVAGDNIEHHITWKSDGAAPVNISGGLEEKMVSQSRGSCKIRLYLDHAKLFAVYTDLI